MIRIADLPVSDRQHDFQQIWDLLTDTHRLAEGHTAPTCNYWSFCRFESWMVYGTQGQRADAELDRTLHLWKTEVGQLVGLAMVEGRGRDLHVITHPDHRDIEPAIITWAMSNWPTVGNVWVTYAEADDAHRRAVLTGLGFRKGAEAEYLHAYDLERVSQTHALPPGFRISDAAEDGDPHGWSRLVSLTFHPERDPGTAPKRVIHLAPSYDPSMDLVVVAPDGRLVAFAIGWINPKSRIAEVEPVGTHPDFRQQGLAKAVVTEAFCRLRERGARYAYIASAPEPNVSNRLYQSLGPVGKQRFVCWTKTGESAGQ